MRVAGRVAAWIVLVGAGLATLFFAAIAIDNDGDSDLILGGVVLAAAALAVAVAAFFAQRALRTRSAAVAERRHATSAEALERAERGETVELRPSRRKWTLMLLGSLVFSVFLVPAAVLEPHLITVSGGLLFGLGVIMSVWSLIPGGAYLRIAPEGLTVKMPFRTRHYAWNAVENFQVFEVQTRYSTQEFVGFDLRALTPERQSLWQTINRGMSGIDASLPDTYGLEAKDLAKALKKLRKHHATEHGLSPSARADRELERQAMAVDTGRRVLVTWVVGAACVAVFGWQAVRYDLAPSAAQLAEIGGATGGAAAWTLLSGNLLHADPVHLVLNLLSWGLAGTLLEREIGAPRMAVLVAIGGLASMGLAILLSPDAVTVGLSGVVFAALAWGVLRDVHRLRTLGHVAWAMLPLGVIYTFFSSGTSIGGHLGGLAAGLLLGWSLDRARAGSRAR